MARKYGTLKRRLAAVHVDDRIGYTDAKAPFIESVLEKAEAWALETGWSVGTAECESPKSRGEKIAIEVEESGR